MQNWWVRYLGAVERLNFRHEGTPLPDLWTEGSTTNRVAVAVFIGGGSIVLVVLVILAALG